MGSWCCFVEELEPIAQTSLRVQAEIKSHRVYKNSLHRTHM